MAAIAESMGSLAAAATTVKTDIGAANQIGIKEVLGTRALEKGAPEKKASTTEYMFGFALRKEK